MATKKRRVEGTGPDLLEAIDHYLTSLEWGTEDLAVKVAADNMQLESAATKQLERMEYSRRHMAEAVKQLRERFNREGYTEWLQWLYIEKIRLYFHSRQTDTKTALMILDDLERMANEMPQMPELKTAISTAEVANWILPEANDADTKELDSPQD